MARLALLTALLLALAVAVSAGTFTKCGCGVNFDCSDLTAWNDLSPDFTVTCLANEQCESKSDLRDTQKSACMVIDYDEAETNEVSVSFRLWDVEQDPLNSESGTNYCYASASSTTCTEWNEELQDYIDANKAFSEEFGKIIASGMAMATGTLIAIILVPILLLALIIGLSIWCCCCRNKPNHTVVVQGGATPVV